MAKRRITKAETDDIIQAAVKVGMNVRLEYRSGGTVVVTFTGKPGEPDGDGNVDKNEWDEVLDGAIQVSIRR